MFAVKEEEWERSVRSQKKLLWVFAMSIRKQRKLEAKAGDEGNDDDENDNEPDSEGTEGKVKEPKKASGRPAPWAVKGAAPRKRDRQLQGEGSNPSSWKGGCLKDWN